LGVTKRKRYSGFSYSRTVALSLSQIALNPNFSGVVNLCSGKGISVREAALRMLYESHFECDDKNIMDNNSSIPKVIGDASKLHSVINTKPQWIPSTYQNSLNIH
jgi:hypothetical protein